MIVADIKAFHSPKFKKDVYTGTADSVIKYVNGYKKYHEDIIKAVETLGTEHYRNYKEHRRLSEKLHRLMIDAYAIVNPDKNKIAYSFRNEQLDIFRVEFTIEYLQKAYSGSKISDLSGGL